MLETKNLLLRKVNEQDLYLFKALLQNPAYLKQLPRQNIYSNDEVKVFLHRRLKHWQKGFGTFVICLKDKPNRSLGFVGIETSPNPMYSDLRFMLLKAYQGHGFAKEASFSCIRFVFEQGFLSDIYSVCLKNNAVSEHILAGLGMAEVKGLNVYPLLSSELKTFHIGN